MSSLKNAVLVLNQSYEPLKTVSVEHAFINFFNGKYYIEEYHEDDKVYRSAKEVWKVPSVVRLKEYKSVNKRKRETLTKRSRIYIRDKYRCSYCGQKGKDKDLTLDHIIPRAKRREYPDDVINAPENLVACCFPCNQKKKDRMLDEAGMKLLHPPKHLKVGLDKVILRYWSEQRPAWAKYLFHCDEFAGDDRYNAR